MSYIDGYVIPVPSDQREAYVEFARKFNPLFKQLGATRIVESWSDDLPEGKQTDFRKAVQTEDDESVVFSWVEWPDKATRDHGIAEMEKMMSSDEQFDPAQNPMPFDGKRMIMGGFEKMFEM